MPKTISDKLKMHLDVIKKTFDVSKIINQEQKEKEIRNYYLINHLPYLLFHNRNGFMHMGLSKTAKFKYDDLLEPLRIVDNYIKLTGAKNVLELGAGNGSDSIYLAGQNREIKFEGLDLSKNSLNKNKRINYKQEIGDYHDLSKYKDESFDIVFVIEALCHSLNKKRVLYEVYKKLKKGGLFIIFDGYYKKPLTDMSKNEKLAAYLTEKAMTVDKFENINDFDKTIKKTPFELVKKENFSLLILPSLKRFERMALAFFKYPVFTRIINKILPLDFTKNSIAGLLMPILIQRNVGCYYLHVLEK